MPGNGTIQGARTEIKRLTRHVKAINPGMKGAFGQSQMFQQLLASLPPAYDTVRDAIDCQGEKDIDILLQRLLENGSLLKTNEKALAVRSQFERVQHQRYSKSSSTDPSNRLAYRSRRLREQPTRLLPRKVLCVQGGL